MFEFLQRWLRRLSLHVAVDDDHIWQYVTTAGPTEMGNPIEHLVGRGRDLLVCIVLTVTQAVLRCAFVMV